MTNIYGVRHSTPPYVDRVCYPEKTWIKINTFKSYMLHFKLYLQKLLFIRIIFFTPRAYTKIL